MWIFCAGMARSASTLQYQIASHLVEGAGLGSRVPWTSADEFPSLRATPNGSREWRVFKCHECPPEIAMELREGDARALLGALLPRLETRPDSQRKERQFIVPGPYRDDE